MYYLIKNDEKDRNFRSSPSIMYEHSNLRNRVFYNPYSKGLCFWFGYRGYGFSGMTIPAQGTTENERLYVVDAMNLVQFDDIATDEQQTVIISGYPNYCYFFHTNSSLVNTTATFDFPYATSTIEIVYQTQQNGTIFVPKNTGNVAFGLLSPTSAALTTTAGSKTLTGDLTGLHTLSINYGDGIALDNINTEIAITSGSNSWTPSTDGKNIIGMRTGQQNYPFRGRLYAIRVYNRKLSIDEMRANQQIDVQYYNLDL